MQETRFMEPAKIVITLKTTLYIMLKITIYDSNTHQHNFFKSFNGEGRARLQVSRVGT